MISSYLDAVRGLRPPPVDWSRAPATYKTYPGAARTGPVTGSLGSLLRDLLGVVRQVWSHASDGAPSLAATRSVPSGGALYPIEAYVAGANALGHYAPAHHVLETVREGDYRAAVNAALAEPLDDPAGAYLLLTAVFWRSGFKYGDFSYRLQCQEVGALLAQACAVAERDGTVVQTHLRFDDRALTWLLGLDPEAEGLLAVLSLPQVPASARLLCARTFPARTAGPARPARPAVPSPPVAGLLPHLVALHRAAGARAPAPTRRVPPQEPPERETIPLLAATPPRAAAGIAARRSTPFGYHPVPIGAKQLAAILAAAWAPGAADVPGAEDGPCTLDLYLVVLNCADIAVGSYRYRNNASALEPVGIDCPGPAIADGSLAANTRAALRCAAAALVPVGDPTGGEDGFGPRWYRVQQAETGMALHRATLAATALGLAARIHSDGTNPATQAALGLSGTGRTPLGFLLLGTPITSGPSLSRRLPLEPGAEGGDDGRPPATDAGGQQ
ncbi:nitroreductase family protein [Actinomadura mexicana]|nr:nitroreductase family protein [Actinomadura mexicana]